MLDTDLINHKNINYNNIIKNNYLATNLTTIIFILE